MRRVLLLAPLVAGLAVACSNEGSTSVDRQRLESVEASELFDVKLPGLQVETPFTTSLATTKTAVLNDGSTTNAAGIAYSFESPPEAADVQAVADAYVEAFVKEGWSDITAECIPTPEGATLVNVSGKRWIDDHEQSGGVELNPLLPNWRVVVGVSAPHHSETGDQPIGNEPQVDCLEEIQVPDEN